MSTVAVASKFPEVFNRTLGVSCMRFFHSVEVPKKNILLIKTKASVPYLSSSRPAVSVDSFKKGFPSLVTSIIHKVLLSRGFSKIFNSVVVWPPVFMIDKVLWPVTVNIKPSKPMCRNPSVAVNAYPSIAIRIYHSGDCSSDPSRTVLESRIPRKETSSLIVAQKLFQFFQRHAGGVFMCHVWNYSCINQAIQVEGCYE